MLFEYMTICVAAGCCLYRLRIVQPFVATRTTLARAALVVRCRMSVFNPLVCACSLYMHQCMVCALQA